jgi:flagellar motility protein MotE (MotC chaperone)
MKKINRPSSLKSLIFISALFFSSAVIRIVVGTTQVSASDIPTEIVTDSPETTEQQGESPNDQPTEGFEEGEVNALLRALNRREQALEQRENVVLERENIVNEARTEIEDKLAKLQDAEQKLRETIALASIAAEDDLVNLTAVYENMKPKQAALLFEKMDPKFSAGFIARMRPDAAAKIMAGLSAEVAYSISAILAGRNAGVPTD